LAPVSYAGAWSPLLGPPDRLRAAARGRSGLADNEVPGGVDYDVSGTEADLVDRTELRHEPRHIKVVLAVGGVESSRVDRPIPRIGPGPTEASNPTHCA
jgi:hypothetical protein